MTGGAIRFEESEFGTRATLIAPWSSDSHQEIMRVRPNELELNTSKGWFGSDLEFIKDYEWMRSFIIIDMKISNISPVMKLRNLINLNIVTYCKTKFDFSLFPDLKMCALEWRAGSESLFDCTALTHLFVNRYKGKDSSLFSGLTNLIYLGIMNASITDLHGLVTLKRLQALRLGGLKSIKFLDGVEGLCQLQNFEMQNCPFVKSLSPLSSLSSLIDINLSNNGRLDSLAPLRELLHLRTVLFYESTDIVDGDLRVIYENPAISKVSFQNRKHYSHKREDFEHRVQG